MSSSSTRHAAEPIHRRRVVDWQPGTDTLLALLTLVAFSFCYYAGTTVNSLFLWVGVLIVGTAIPLWTILVHRRESVAELGIRRRFLVLSLSISLVLGAGSAYQVFALAHAQEVSVWAHLAANFLVLWEPFFVFGWLYLRWERAFGWLPAIVLTGIGFIVQHLGSVPLEAAVGFGIFALGFAGIFALVRNLAVLWPLFYPVASGIGTLQAGFAMGWSDAAVSGLVLAGQLLVFWWLASVAAARRRAAAA